MGALIDQIENKKEIVEDIKGLIKENFELSFKKHLIGDVVATKVSLHVPKDTSIISVCEFTEQIGAGSGTGRQAIRGLREIASRYVAARTKLSGIKPENVSAGKSILLHNAIIAIGTFTALEKLTAQEVVATPVPIQGNGAGPQKTALDPMLLELTRGAAVKTGERHNVITALGIALVASCTNKFGTIPKMIVSSTGYGVLATNSEKESVLVTVSGRKGCGETDPRENGEIMVVETNIDDMNPEIFPYAVEQILSAGAVDAFLTPVIMKKGRPANLLTVLCDEKNLDRVAEVIFRETTTLGIRIRKEKRRRLKRKLLKVSTPYGEINIKAGYYAQDWNPIQLSPEFEECREIAQRTGAPLKDVYWAARRAAQKEEG